MTTIKKNRISTALANDNMDNARVLEVVDCIADTLEDVRIKTFISSMKITPREVGSGISEITLLCAYPDVNETRTAFIIINPERTIAQSGPEIMAQLRAVSIKEAVNMYEDGKAEINAEINYSGDRMMTVGTIIDAVENILINDKNTWAVLGIDGGYEEEGDEDDE